MKRFAAILPLLLLLCFAPQGRAANYYWGGDLGLSALDYDAFSLTLKNVPGYQRQSVNLKHAASSTALGAAFIYGLDFGWAGRLPLRLELEGAVSGGGRASGKQGHYATPQGGPDVAEIKMQMEVDWLCFVGLNLWLDIPTGSFPVKPYLGGSLGYNFIFYNAEMAVNPNFPPSRATGNASGRAAASLYRLGGGARLALGKRTFLDFGLRYAKKQSWGISAPALDLDFSSRALEARLGLRYYF